MCVYTHTMSMKQTRVNVIERRLCVVEQKQREEKRRERGGRGILLCIYAYGGVVCVFCLFVCLCVLCVKHLPHMCLLFAAGLPDGC